MTEYRIEFKESELAHIGIVSQVLDCLRKRGEVREVVKDTSYYLSADSKIEGVLDLFSQYKGVRIWKLQGELLTK